MNVKFIFNKTLPKFSDDYTFVIDSLQKKVSIWCTIILHLFIGYTINGKQNVL